jgi:mycobactin peptide synthetase MbtE
MTTPTPATHGIRAAEGHVLKAARELLDEPGLTLDDDLFEAGLTSLIALRLADRLTAVLGRDVAVAEIYHATTLRGIQRGHEGAAVTPDPQAADGSVPASRAQRRFWLAEQYTPAAADNMLVLAYEIKGPLDVEALHRAFADLLRRHAVLRTRYGRRGSDLTQDVMAIEDAGIRLESVDPPAAGLAPEQVARHITADWWSAPFEFDRRPPVRARLCRIDDESHLLCLQVHHIAFDGRSERLVIDDLCALYRTPGDRLPPVAATYADFSRRERVAGVDEADLSFWRKALSDAPAPFLPPPVNPVAEADRQEIVRHVPPTTVDLLQSAARRRHSPALAALAAATARAFTEVFYVSDVCLGAITEGRVRSADNAVIGYFVNPLALPLRGVGDRDTLDLLDHAARQLRGALKHAQVPFDELVRLLRPQRPRHPWFQALVSLQYEPPRGELVPGTTIRTVRIVPSRTATEFSVQAFPLPDGGWETRFAWRTDGCDTVHAAAVADGVLAALERTAELSGPQRPSADGEGQA